MIDSQMVELHNERVAYFSQKAASAPDDLMVQGEENHCVIFKQCSY